MPHQIKILLILAWTAALVALTKLLWLDNFNDLTSSLSPLRDNYLLIGLGALYFDLGILITEALPANRA